MPYFEILVGVAAFLAGAVASVTGFGIGSLLTPLLSLRTGMKLAVAAVSLPHLAGTMLRFWRLKGSMDRRVFLSFGLPSAAGGLVGALIHTYATSPALTALLGLLLLFAGTMSLTGYADRLRFRGATAWVAGALSGLFGGMVGNQGGIRSAGLLGFDVSKEAFVATATAVGLIVDGVRMPIYLVTEGAEIAQVWPLVGAATVGVLAGTLAGEKVLRRVPEPAFRRIIAAVLIVLGIMLLAGAMMDGDGRRPLFQQ
jgi:uncharacterized membrane protein YfcA